MQVLTITRITGSCNDNIAYSIAITTISAGREIDAVLELSDGRWGAFEIKLGADQIDEAAKKLIAINKYFESRGARVPSFLCVVCGLSSAAYLREDGVYVVPINCLKN